MKTRNVLTAAFFIVVAALFVLCALWLLRPLSATPYLAIIVGQAASIFARILLIAAVLLVCFALFLVWAAFATFRKKTPPVSHRAETDQTKPKPYRRAALAGLASLAVALMIFVLVSRVHSHPGIRLIKDLYRPGTSAAAWSPDGKRIATLSNLFTHTTIWDVETGTAIREFDTPLQGCNCLVFTSDGNFVITPAEVRPETDRHSALTLWSADTGERSREIAGPAPDKPAGHNVADRFAISHDGKQLALNAGAVTYATLALYRDPDWTAPVVLPIETEHVYDKDSASAIEFSPDGRELAVGTWGHYGPKGRGAWVYLFDVATAKLIWRTQIFEDQVGKVGSLAFRPDGRSIAVGAADSFHSERRPDGTWEKSVAEHPLVLLDSTTGDVLRILSGATQKINSMSWSPDGQILATMQEDRSIRFWSMENPDAPARHLGLSGWPMSVSFAPEGLRFVVADGKATIGEIAR